MRASSFRLVASSSATRIRSLDFLLIFLVIRKQEAAELYIFVFVEKRCPPKTDAAPDSRASGVAIKIPIVSGPTLNYNG